MNCQRCHGRGWRPKHIHCDHNTQDAYVRGCHEKRVCHACLGTGSTGAKLIKAALLQIKLDSNDFNSRNLAEQALKEIE